MLATKLLEKQHRKAESMLNQLESGRGDGAEILSDLADALAAHMLIEQDIFYPAIRQVDEDLILESYEEHSLVELSLKRLLNTELTGEYFIPRVTTLKELIQRHVEEEESELFPKVEKALGPARLSELGAEMESRFVEAEEDGFEASIPEGFDETSADAALAIADDAAE
jgi:iron-sulfur cluster repair protein YtfE (RIC family)